MKIIVGLGNPGNKYRGTRHNIGFEVIAALHEQFDRPRPTAKFNSEIAEIRIGGEKVLLQSPLTFMNLSGQAVRSALDYYKLSPHDLLVICDDFSLTLGRLRFKPLGSAGGQNGLADIIQRLGTPEFARLRIGIGQPPEGWKPANWVLGRFQSDELSVIEPVVGRAAQGAVVWVEQGIATCMNRFNADPARPAAPEPRSETGADSMNDPPGPVMESDGQTKRPTDDQS